VITTCPSPTHRALSRAVVLYLLALSAGLHLIIAWPAARSTVIGLFAGAGAALACCYLIIRRTQ